MSRVFDLAFYTAAPFWALMILAPTWTGTKRIIGSPWIVAPTLIVWATAALPRLGPLLQLVTAPSLASLEALATDPAALTYLWTQIIAWDLFIGRWIYLDSRDRAIHPLIMAPILILTILLSPIGLPIYIAIRPKLSRQH
ncbi:ABA4-like family protein [Nocardia gipuzkoensis]